MGDVTLKDRLAMRERPEGTPIMHQDWKNLLFLHWEHESNAIQETLPPGLFVDTFKGKGYITMNPFFLENLSIAGTPSLPGFSNFLEVNVRTYVYDKNREPGIWFYSLDINGLVAAQMAREAFSLPYFFSDLQCTKESKSFIFEGKRVDEPHGKMKCIYESTSEVYEEAKQSSLDFFLLERYALFSYSANELKIGRVHHSPYPIGNAHVSEFKTNLLEANGFNLSTQKPNLVHYSPGVSVDIFALNKV